MDSAHFLGDLEGALHVSQTHEFVEVEFLFHFRRIVEGILYVDDGSSWVAFSGRRGCRC